MRILELCRGPERRHIDHCAKTTNRTTVQPDAASGALWEQGAIGTAHGFSGKGHGVMALQGKNGTHPVGHGGRDPRGLGLVAWGEKEHASKVVSPVMVSRALELRGRPAPG
jgi:hypothetical protein